MKKLVPGFLAMSVFASLLVAAQASPLPGDNSRSAAYVRGLNISGKVGDDGKTFLADDDNRWIVSNPGALKGQEGRYVILKCRMDLSNRAIQVLSVHQQSAETRPASSDSAFRR